LRTFSAVIAKTVHRARIGNAIRVGIDRKGRKIVGSVAVLVHVAPHKQCPERSQRHPVNGFPINIGSQRQRRLAPRIEHIGHLFDTNNHCQIDCARCNSETCLTQRHSTRRAACLDGHGFDAGDASGGCNQRSHLTLSVQRSAEGAGNVERANP
jgi:hypothetical protein